MVSFDELQSKRASVCVVGLGYVGLPLAVILSQHFSVIGFDVNEKRVAELTAGTDATREVSSEDLGRASVRYTADPAAITESRFIIIAVPTPIDETNTPDLSILKAATTTVAEHLQSGSVVVYESTVYPGATEEVCLPILEQLSGLQSGTDFHIGYSPERVNPGDKEHTIDKIVKVVSGQDAASLELIASVYGTITQVFRAASIRVAEAAKVIENTQRDLNIALMNELAILFSKMGISIYDVLDAAGTKWNFLKFTPGLVGGHCIGVDPYYLTHKAEEVGHRPEVILAGRGINDSMHTFLAQQIADQMSAQGKDIGTSQIVILGLTFKENVPDIRNSKVALLYQELKRLGADPVIWDPHADAAEVQHESGFSLVAKEDLPAADTLVVAVAHDEFRALGARELKTMGNGDRLLVVDVKHVYDREEIESEGMMYWSL